MPFDLQRGLSIRGPSSVSRERTYSWAFTIAKPATVFLVASGTNCNYYPNSQISYHGDYRNLQYALSDEKI